MTGSQIRDVTLCLVSDPLAANRNAFMTDDESRMTTFLQRAEVRLSTMHRIGGLFLNGAGLLFVLPIFFRDTFLDVINLTRYNASSWSLYPLFFLLMITVAVPALAMLLLLRDLVDFYFVGEPAKEAPNHGGSSYNLRFVLSALAMPGASPDPNTPDPVKLNVIEEQRKDLVTLQFVLPSLQDCPEHYQRMLDESSRTIIPPQRRAACQNDPGLSLVYSAFGLAGLEDRTLVSEVARAEASLVRHVLALRRLVLRYLKALLVLFWTIGVFLVSSKWVSVSPHIVGAGEFHDPRVTLALVTGFFVWSAITPFVVRFPVRWIHVKAFGALGHDGTFRDRDLVSFELKVIALSVCAFAIASVLLFICLADAFHLDGEWLPITTGLILGFANATYWFLRIRRAVGTSSDAIVGQELT